MAKAGFRVKFTRTDDRAVTPRKRLRMASRLKPDLFLSLHCNASASPSESGIETFAYLPERQHRGRGSVVPVDDAGAGTQSSLNARLLHERLCRAVSEKGLEDNGVRMGRFMVLAPRPWPSILIEMGYLTNKRDAGLLASKRYRAWFAASLSKVVTSVLDKEDGQRILAGQSDPRAAVAN